MRALAGHLLRFIWRALAWTCSLLSAIVFLFLGGYFLGWKTAPPAPAIPLVEPETAPATPSPKPIHLRQRAHAVASVVPHDQARMRLARWARLNILDLDQPNATAHVCAEIAALTLDETYAALVVLETAPTTGPLEALRFHLMERWATLDPRAALQHSLKRANPAAGALTGAVLARWAFSDPSAALGAWREIVSADASANAFGPQGDYGLSRILDRMAALNLDNALTEASGIPEPHQSRAWQALARHAARDDAREQVLAAILALPQADLRGDSLAAALDAWSDSGASAEAWEWLASAHLDRSATARVEEQLARNEFFTSDPVAVADWLIAGAQTPEERSQRLRLVVAEWASEDPIACGQWLVTQPLDGTAAPAMQRYAFALAPDYPAEALAWARRIPDEAVRRRAEADVQRQIRRFFGAGQGQPRKNGMPASPARRAP